MGILTDRSRPLLWAGLLLPALAQSEQETPEDACRYASLQPEHVDFDQPREQLQYRPDLLIPPDARIREIRIHRQPIFNTDDPDQDNWLYRGINAINIQTREAALASQLVFGEGERYSALRLDESERALRDRPYLTGAWVRPYRVCGDEVDVAVVTRDTWTFFPSVGISRSGGETSTRLSLTDENFLGSGKEVSVSRSSDADRTETSFDYHDPNLFGSRWQADLGYAERSDGRGRHFGLERPFYRKGARWSFALDAERDEREESRFFGGDEVSDFRRELTQYGFHYGHSLGDTSRADRRLLVGYRYREDVFREVVDEPAPEPFPQDRTRSYPWLEFQWQEQSFHETVNLTQIQRVEDVRDGIDFRSRIGYSSPGLGGSDDRLVLEHHFSDGLVSSDTTFADYRLTQEGDYLFNQGQFENLRTSLRSRIFRGGLERWNSWYAMLELTAAHNLTADQQLFLGGDTGVRGFPRNYQTGNRRFVLTAERRYFPDWHPFSLFRLGGVVFMDAGRAWFTSDDPNGPDSDVLTNVGVGLRAASSRFEVNRMLHLDFAVPVDSADDDIDRFQVLLRGRASF